MNRRCGARMLLLLATCAGGCSISTAGNLDGDAGPVADARGMDVRIREDAPSVDTGPREDRFDPCAFCGAMSTCIDDVCECMDGFADCDGVAGCETSITTDPLHCGGCGRRCDPPTPACIDGTCASCATAAECGDDGLSCTTADCRGETCIHDISPGTCLIDGECYADDERNPRNRCEVCHPRLTSTEWSAAAGRPCDDGSACTVADACSDSGACEGSPMACDDALTCTTDFCDEDTGTCVFAPVMGFCKIGSTCYPDGTGDPDGDGCRVCDVRVSATDWTPLADDTSCGPCNQICCGGRCTNEDAGHCGACGRSCDVGACGCSSCSMASCRCG